MRRVDKNGVLRICSDDSDCIKCGQCEIKKSNNMEDTEKTNSEKCCASCKFGCKNIHAETNAMYFDKKCNFSGVIRTIFSDEVHDGKAPYWCPLIGKKEVKYKDLPYDAKTKLWFSLTPVINWEDIKVNQVYHVPPYFGEKRKDILITAKSPSSLYYRIANSDSRVTYTIYPGSLMAKFIIPREIPSLKKVVQTV